MLVIFAKLVSAISEINALCSPGYTYRKCIQPVTLCVHGACYTISLHPRIPMFITPNSYYFYMCLTTMFNNDMIFDLYFIVQQPACMDLNIFKMSIIVICHILLIDTIQLVNGMPILHEMEHT